MSTQGPAGPGYWVAPTNDPHLGQPGAPTPAHRSSRIPTAIIILVTVVVVLAVAGFTAWMVIRNNNDTTPPVTPSATDTTPTQTPSVPPTDHPTQPTVVPFELLNGTPDSISDVEVLGVWSDIAVIDSWQPHGSDGSDVALPTTSTLQAFDTRTGKSLWTYDALPDGSAFAVRSSAADADHLAVALEITDPNPAIIKGTQVQILDLTTGDVLQSRFVDPKVTAGEESPDSDTPVYSYEDEEIAGYQDGILVIHHATRGVYESPGTYTSTSAYADTDLTAALWTVTGAFALSNGIDGWGTGDHMLPGGYVLTASGSYVSLHDGSPTHMTVTPYTDDGDTWTYFGMGDSIVARSSLNPGPVKGVDPSTGDDLWTYTLPTAAPGLTPSLCSTGDTLIIATTAADDDGSTSSVVAAMNVQTGAQAWEVTLGAGDTTYGNCSILNRGDQPLAAISTFTSDSATVSILDTVTGDSIATLDASAATACAPGFACMITYGSDTTVPSTVSAYDLSTPADPPLWTRNLILMNDAKWTGISWYVTDAGMVFIGSENGQYEFLVY